MARNWLIEKEKYIFVGRISYAYKEPWEKEWKRGEAVDFSWVFDFDELFVAKTV